MKKQLLSILLALCTALLLCLAALPASAAEPADPAAGAAAGGGDMAPDEGTAVSAPDGGGYDPLAGESKANGTDDVLERLRGAGDGDVVTLAGDHRAGTAQDVDIAGGSAARPVVLDLNGHTLTVEGDGDLIVNGALRICDSSGTDAGTLELDRSSYIHVRESGYLFLDSGAVSGGGGDGGDDAGDKYPCTVRNIGNFTMAGGTINGGSSGAGQTDDGIFINPCTVYNTGNFTVTGGTINAIASAFAVRNTGGDCHFTMKGGTINGGSSSYSYAVHSGYMGSFTMEGGVINGGTGDYSCAACFDYGMSALMKGGTINGGSGIESHAVYNSRNFTMNEGTINGGTGDGSNAVENVGYFVMYGGAINGGGGSPVVDYNGTTVYPRAVHNYSSATFYMEGGTISGNGSHAFTNDYNCYFTMAGGEVTSFSPDATLSCTGGTLTLEGGTITNSGSGYALKKDDKYGFVRAITCAGVTFRAGQKDYCIGGLDTPAGYTAAEEPAEDGYYYLARSRKGTCGINLTWEYDKGVLTISGTGDMYDYTSSAASPWSLYRADIKTVIIGNGTAHMGAGAFSGCTSLRDVYYGGSEEEWRQICGESSPGIPDGANILCNSASPEPYTVRPALFGGRGVECTVSSIFSAAKDVYVAAALYEESGKLREIKMQPLKLEGFYSGDAVLYFTVDPSATDYVAVFLLDQAGCAPLCSPNRDVTGSMTK